MYIKKPLDVWYFYHDDKYFTYIYTQSKPNVAIYFCPDFLSYSRLFFTAKPSLAINCGLFHRHFKCSFLVRQVQFSPSFTYIH